jgi:epoxyqueuosine reductase QueG
MGKKENTEEILRLAISSGVDAAGIADLKDIRGIRTYPKDLLSGYKYGISLVVGLDKYDAYDMEVEGDISYRILRATCAIIANRIRKRGYRAMVPDLDDPVRWKGPLYFKSPLSMKAVANASGLGWIGKSAVLVSYDYGPRVNLGTVVTDMPMTAGRPSRNQCGRCSACAKACPVGALTATTFDVYPKDLRKVLEKERCNDWLERPSNRVPSNCWECVLACPKGKKPKKYLLRSQARAGLPLGSSA